MLTGDKENSMGAALAYNTYRRSEIETLTPRDLLVKLFEGLERFVEQGALAMDNHHLELATKSTRRIRDILFELQSTLNHEAGGEIAKRLDELYSFMIIEVNEASLFKDSRRLRQLQRIIRPLKEGWRGVPDAHANTTSLIGASHSNVINLRG
jgi:flagellar protein FliS